MPIDSVRERPVQTSGQAIQARIGPVPVAVGVWALLIVVAFLWGSRLNRTTAQHLGAPPLFGHFHFMPAIEIAGMIAVGGTVVAGWARVAAHLRWRPFLAAAWASTLAWTIALNTVRGFHQLSAPLITRFEYRSVVASVGDPGRFLATYVSRLSSYPIHVEGHPPGMVLVLWFMKQLGLGAPGWEAALVILGGTSSVVAALVACRSIAGEARARRCAPFLILAPMALWVATSADALFLGVSAWSVVLIILAMERSALAGRLQAMAGGALFGLALILSYGAAALALIPMANGLRKRALDILAVATVTAVSVIGVFWIAGFSWLSGFEATRRLYQSGVAEHRPYAFFFVANLAAFAIVIGPGGAAGLATFRNRSIWLIVGATVVALLLSNLSGYSKGEVERIWLPFAPWILLATSDIPTPAVPALLSLQALVAVAVAVGVRTAW